MRLHFQGEHGHIDLAQPGRRRLADGLSRPKGMIWVVVTMFVKEGHRGEGRVQDLLATVAQKLTEDYGPVWVGLKSDVLRGPQTSDPRAQSAWETFCTNHGLTRQGPLALFADDIAWSND